MSDEQEMAARGRMVTEYADLKRRLLTLYEEAKRLGKMLETFGHQLGNDPGTPGLQSTLPNIDRIPALLAEYREASEHKIRIEKSLREMGILDPS